MAGRQRFRGSVTGIACAAVLLSGVALASPSASAAPVVGGVRVASTTPTPTPTTPPTKPPTKPRVRTCTAPLVPKQTKPYPRFYRETTRPGMVDGGPFSIHHVREAQYRLRWAHVYKGVVNGYYGASTKTAVKKFQKRYCLRATGVLNRATWSVLIRKTIRHVNRIPKVCRESGWHSCYDRSIHQDLLFHNGVLWNAWLVRGGQLSTPTRTGTYVVFARYVTTISTLYHVRMWYFMPHSGGEGQHGSGFMVDPFVGHSHGCINLYIKDARVLFRTTQGQKLTVTVYGHWA